MGHPKQGPLEAASGVRPLGMVMARLSQDPHGSFPLSGASAVCNRAFQGMHHPEKVGKSLAPCRHVRGRLAANEPPFLRPTSLTPAGRDQPMTGQPSGF